MESTYSTTQSTNLLSIAGVVVIILARFNLNIEAQDVATLFGAVATGVGIVMNWYHRYQKGDLTLGGFRKW